jgi:cytochrome P450
LLSDADARTAFDRLAAAKFREHVCADHLSRLGMVVDDESFTARIRKLVSQGFKPKDAVELFLQEAALEFRNEPKTLARAKAEGEDFLRRVKAGLI